MPRILGRKEQVKGKALNLKFTIDCKHPVEDKILLLNDFEDYLKKKVKLNGKTGNLEGSVTISHDKTNLIVSSTV
jgi:large subunit ribosomal protein L22e